MRNGKNRLMEIANASGPGTEPTLTTNPMIALGHTSSIQVREAENNPRMVLLQQLVLSIKKSNAMKK